MLHKRTLAVVLLLEGLPTGAHPVRAAMDPSRGRWLLAGGGDGRLYRYSLSPPQTGGTVAVPPCMVADVAPAAAARHVPPLYCVAWSPTLHMVAACSCRRAGHITVLCSPAGGAGQRCDGPRHHRVQHPDRLLWQTLHFCYIHSPCFARSQRRQVPLNSADAAARTGHVNAARALPGGISRPVNVCCGCRAAVFRPCASKRTLQLEIESVGRGAAGERGGATGDAARPWHSAARYRLPEEVDGLFVKTLLHRIRSDLHARGLLESADAPLTRGPESSASPGHT